MDLLKFTIAIVVLMALAFATGSPIQLFQVLQLALNEALTVTTLPADMLNVLNPPALTMVVVMPVALTVTLQQLPAWFTVK